ncbi:hypothetical protein [Glaciecola sp. 33A]|jgi:hypothetical protein|uniref:hypothetical protein n=1 Tax=Glaciecola sp. 33A TaxID=2057807 RepID=UPI001E60C7E4|nr:hypothetical protein [Glaciecola sp. 33A]
MPLSMMPWSVTMSGRKIFNEWHSSAILEITPISLMMDLVVENINDFIAYPYQHDVTIFPQSPDGVTKLAQNY